MGVALRKRRAARARALATLIWMALLAVPVGAHAQDSFDAQSFKPALSRTTAFVSAYGADVVGESGGSAAAPKEAAPPTPLRRLHRRSARRSSARRRSASSCCAARWCAA